MSGLDKPFVVRSFNFLKNALTLNLGRATYMSSDAGSRQVRNIILERLPATLLLTGSSSLINFFLTVAIGLSLSRSMGAGWINLSSACRQFPPSRPGFIACS